MNGVIGLSFLVACVSLIRSNAEIVGDLLKLPTEAAGHSGHSHGHHGSRNGQRNGHFGNGDSDDHVVDQRDISGSNHDINGYIYGQHPNGDSRGTQTVPDSAAPGNSDRIGSLANNGSPQLLSRADADQPATRPVVGQGPVYGNNVPKLDNQNQLSGPAISAERIQESETQQSSQETHSDRRSRDHVATSPIGDQLRDPTLTERSQIRTVPNQSRDQVSNAQATAPAADSPTRNFSTVDSHSGDEHEVETSATGHDDAIRGADSSLSNYTRHEIHVASWNYGYVQKPLLISLFIIVLSLIKILFHHARRISAVVPESCLLIVLGIVIGLLFLIEHAQNELKFVHFNSQTFFLYLLPPIILEAAYSLRDRAFAENLGTIMLYAVVGTILNILIVGPILYGIYAVGFMGPSLHLRFLECLIFSAVVAAVDPVAVLAIFQELGVNKMLYFMVFGESLFNDAVTVVVYNMVVSFMQIEKINVRDIGLGLAAFLCVSLGGIVIGFFCGFLTAFMTKYTTRVRVVEPIILFGMAYLSYLAAELFHFSGIISIICCGIIQSHYAVENISSKSYISVHYFSKVASGVTESLIFIILGVMLVNDYKSWLDANVAFIMCGLFLCLAARFAVVFSLAYCVNRFLVGIRRINKQEQFIMAYGGLRGAITFSLVFMLDPQLLSGNQEKKNLLLTATYIIIFFTTFLQGITIKPLVKIMRIKLQAHDCSIFREVHRAVLENFMAGVEEVIGHKGTHYWTVMSKRVSRRFLRPLLHRHPYKKGTRLVATYQEVEIQRQLSHVSSDVGVPKPAMLMNELEAYDNLDMPNKASDARLDLQDEHYTSLQKQQAAERKARAKHPQFKLENPRDLLHLRDMLQLTPNKTMHYIFDPNLSNEDKEQKKLVESIRNMAAIRKKSVFGRKAHKREIVRNQLIGTALLPLGMGIGLAQCRSDMETIDETPTPKEDEQKRLTWGDKQAETKLNGEIKKDTENVIINFASDKQKKTLENTVEFGNDDSSPDDEREPLC